MNKKIVVIILLLVILYHHSQQNKDTNIVPKPKPPVIVPEPVPPVDIELSFAEILERIRDKDIQEYIEKLSSEDFEGRGTGEKGNEKAAKYICDHLDKLGIEYKKQTFNARGKQTSNIIAYISPKTSNDNSIIVIGAHFDHLGKTSSSYYPGADDNASGTAALMAIATALSEYKNQLKHTISIQFYSAEEMGLIGSDYYTKNPLLPLDNPNINDHIAMINLDMIGYLKSGYSNENMTDLQHAKTTNHKIEMHDSESDYSLFFNMRGVVEKLSEKYPFAKNICGYRAGGSDHTPFLRKNIPVVFIHTGTHPYYHTPRDTPDRLNYKGIEMVTKLALEIIEVIDKS